jgi:DNA replication protein DnaC
MLIQPTVDKLRQMRLYGMVAALEEQSENTEYQKLSFDERLGFLVDWEWTDRKEKRLASRIRKAKFREKAFMDSLDLSKNRGLDRRQVLYLAQPDWINNHQNVIIVGATGTGKTYLACALGNAACGNGFPVQYFQTVKLLRELKAAHVDGSYEKFLNRLAKTRLLILDDWLLDNLDLVQTRDLLEVMDDRFNTGSTIFTTQLPVSEWHSRFGDPTLADAMMDRVVHNAYRLILKGESQRKKQKNLTQTGH